MEFVKIDIYYGAGYCVSKHSFPHWCYVVNISKLVGQEVAVLIEAECCNLSREVVNVPQFRDRIVVGCATCKKVIFRASGLVTGAWKMEVPTT